MIEFTGGEAKGMEILSVHKYHTCTDIGYAQPLAELFEVSRFSIASSKKLDFDCFAAIRFTPLPQEMFDRLV